MWEMMKRNERSLFFAVCLAFVALSLLCVRPLPAAETTPVEKTIKTGFTMGVLPYMPTALIEEVFAPIAAEIGQTLGREIRLRSPSAMRDYSEKLSRGEFEIAYLQPFDYILFAEKAHYLPLAARFEKLSAAFTVMDDSPMRIPADLRGKIVGSPPVEGAVSYLTKVALYKLGLKPGRDVTLKNFSTQESCFQQLQIGNIDVCASGPAVIRVYEERAKVRLRILVESPKIPPNFFVVHNRVAPRERAMITESLVSDRISRNNPGLSRLFMEDKERPGRYFRAVAAPEYEPVRRYLNEIKSME